LPEYVEESTNDALEVDLSKRDAMFEDELQSNVQHLQT